MHAMPATAGLPDRRARRWVWAAATALIAGVVLALTPALSASAHDYPVTWSPKLQSTVTKPLHKVSITFDDIVLTLGGNEHTSLLQVTGPGKDGRHFETACTTTKGRTISVPVALGSPGSYTIKYQIVSADGHVVSGSGVFDYQPPNGTPAADGSATAACQDAGPESTPVSSATTAAPRTGSPALLGVVLTIVGIIVLLLIAGVVVIVLTTRRRRDPRPPGREGTPEDDAGDDPGSLGV